MATIINPRDLTLSTATPRTVQVNMPSSYNWTGTLNGTPVNSVVVNALAGADHSVMTGNVHNVSLIQISGDLDDIADGSSYFRATSSHIAGANRALNALDSSSDYIRSLVSTKLTVVGSNPTTGWVGDTNGIRLYQSGSLRINLPVSGSPSFSGDITGGSNINISGSAIFNGSYSGGDGIASVHANLSQSSNVGIIGYCGSNGVGVRGTGRNSTGTPGIGGLFVTNSTSQPALRCVHDTLSRVALSVSGRIEQIENGGTNALLATSVNGLLSAGSTTINGSLSISSTSLVNNLNAQLHGGKTVDKLCSIIVTNAGTANCGGNGFQLHSTVAGTRTWSDGTNLIRIESTSDKKLKREIIPEKFGLDFINKLKPVSYRLKSDPKTKYHGFIAQDIERLIDKRDGDALFQEHQDGIKGTDYMCLIAPLVKAVQELSTQLKDDKYVKEARSLN